MRPMKPRNPRGDKGQAAVFITVLLMFAFIGLAALAIDGGHLYVVRRDLQNMVDAGCLAAATELSLGGDATAAWQVAREYIIRNGLELFSAWGSPADNVGGGSGLTWGIEVTGAEVRVALLEGVPTYFTMIFNRSEAEVGARARCNSQAGGGLLPIGVRRYEYSEERPTEQMDIVANKNCQPPDCYYGNDFSEVVMDGYYGPAVFRPITNTEWIPEPGALQDDPTGNIDCDLEPEDGVLEGVCVLGVHPETNDGTAKYSGFVSLDIRNITGGCPAPGKAGGCGIQYYNGASGQDATNKALSSEWFCGRGWKGWRVPELGDQLAFLPGVSASFSPKTMTDCGWRVGDQFVAVIYSGYVWDVPDFEMRIEPKVNQASWTDVGDTHTVTYTVYLEKPPPSKPWEGAANFELDAFLMVEDDPANPITPTIGLQPSVWFPWHDDVIDFPMTITVTDPVSSTITYLTAVTVQARETTFTNLKRWASTNFVYGDVTNDFTFYPGGLEYVVEQGNVLHIPFTARGFGFAESKVRIEGELFQEGSCTPSGWGSFFGPNRTDQVTILDGADSTNKTFDLEVNLDAPVGRRDVCLTVRKGNNPSHTVVVTVNIIEPLEGGTPTRFVIVEGFAPFEISYMDVNDIVAFAIGPIVPDLSQVTAGTRAALLPW